MLQINVKEKENQKPMKQWFVGKASKILSTLQFELTFLKKKKKKKRNFHG